MGSRRRFARLLYLVLATLVLAGALSGQDGTFQKDAAAWRADHAKDLLKPDGWLSLIGLEWLQPGDNSVGSAADNKIRLPKAPTHLAVLHLEGETVTLNPPSGGFPQGFLVAGAPAKHGNHRAGTNQNKVAPRMTIGDLNL